MRALIPTVLIYIVCLLSEMTAMAQGGSDDLVTMERSIASDAANVEAIRFREMLKKYKPLQSDEFVMQKVSNEDLSTLFEIHIDIPELGEVRITTLLFTAQSHEVDPIYSDWLDHFSRTLKRYPLAHVRIEAHTDSVGSESSNQVLSELRALEVKSQLIQRGIPEVRIIAVGQGERFPLVSNADAAGRRQNRRVEFRTFFPVHRR